MDPNNDNLEQNPLAEQPATSEGTAAAPIPHQHQTETLTEPQQGTVDYALAGREFTDWFNQKLKQLPNSSIRLGTKTATAIELHPDGKMKCSLHASDGEPEEISVAFEVQYLDQLLRKITANSL